MDAVGLIVKRHAGHVRVAFVSYYGQPVDDVLRRLGLASPEPSPHPPLTEITRSEALTVIVALLHRDMAYRVELMSVDEALQFGESFLGSFASDTTYFSNRPRVDAASWNPLTLSTFDSGVIALSKSVAGCIWVEDED